MDTTTPVQEQCTKRKHNKEERQKFLLNLIEQHGFAEQNQKLVELGFNKLKKNLKLLDEFNGNFDLVLQRLQEKKERGEHKHHKGHSHSHSHGHKEQEGKEQENEKHHGHGKGQVEAQLKELGFEAANQQLKEAGFVKERWNLRVLQKFNGDVTQSLQFLTESKQKWKELKGDKQKKADPEFKKLKQELKQKLHRLEGEGFTRKWLNIKLLALFNGDVERVLLLLKVRQQARKEKQEQLQKELKPVQQPKQEEVKQE